MSYNQQVTDNINQLKRQVKEAKSQDQLVNIIQSVQAHTGPLDYKDTALTIILWSFLLLGSVMLFLAVTDTYLPIITQIIGYTCYSAHSWLPALVVYIYLRQREEKSKVTPLISKVFPDSANKRIGAITLSIALLTFFTPPWAFVFWDGVNLLSMYLSIYDPAIFISLSMLVSSFFLWRFLRKRKHWRKPISNDIHHLDTLLNNDFKTVSFNPDEKIKDLLAKFKEFHRGNDAKEIQHLYKREYQGAVHTFTFEMYRFHYVRKTTESYTDSNGNRRTRTRRVSYYRHGILMNFPFAKSLCINSDSEISHKGEKYTTASNQFNRRFKVRTKDELQTARFLTPAVIELLTQMDQLLKNLNIEITGQNELCLSFDDDNLLKAKQVNDLSNPEAFAKEIAQHAELKTLDTLLEHIHDLMRLSDNNFI